MKRVLLVDDMVDLLEEEAGVLEEADLDIKVTTADSAAKAEELLKNKSFDLIILDLMMPKTNGLELLHRIKRDFNIPCIIYSAYIGKWPTNDLYAEGADLVLSKPARLDMFLNSVKTLLHPESNTQAKVQLREDETKEVTDLKDKIAATRFCLFCIAPYQE